MMSKTVLTILYFTAIVIQIMIRAPYRRQVRQNMMTDDRMDASEQVLLGLLFLGSFVVPLIYALTPWLDFANYALPGWASAMGVVLAVASLIIFWRAHVDLGRNWSPTLQIRKEHDLITHGIYRYIRHPMYAAEWVLACAQVLLLHNYIAGFSMLVLFAPLYFVRVPREEQMMVDAFGDAYRDYARRTGRVFPKLKA